MVVGHIRFQKWIAQKITNNFGLSIQVLNFWKFWPVTLKRSETVELFQLQKRMAQKITNNFNFHYPFWNFEKYLRMTLKQVKRSKILKSNVIHHFGLFWVEKLVGANDFFGKWILDLNTAKRSKFKKCDVIHQFGLFWVEKLFGANDFNGKWIIDL